MCLVAQKASEPPNSSCSQTVIVFVVPDCEQIDCRRPLPANCFVINSGWLALSRLSLFDVSLHTTCIVSSSRCNVHNDATSTALSAC